METALLQGTENTEDRDQSKERLVLTDVGGLTWGLRGAGVCALGCSNVRGFESGLEKHPTFLVELMLSEVSQLNVFI